MSRIWDRNYLLNQQYRDSSNLDARAALHARFASNPQNWQRWVFDQWEVPAAARLLELGCGPAKLWLANLDRLPAEWVITLSDFSPGMVETAQRLLADAPHAFAFETIDAQHIPYEAGTFDAVIANHMLYHVPDIPQALSEIRRVLKPGGRLYAATNGINHMRELDALLAPFAPDRPPVTARGTYPFRLENGGDLLAPHFESVALRRYVSALVVTEVEPLVAYARSMKYPFLATDDALAAFGQLAAQEMAVTGAIRITTDTGLFIAQA